MKTKHKCDDLYKVLDKLYNSENLEPIYFMYKFKEFCIGKVYDILNELYLVKLSGTFNPYYVEGTVKDIKEITPKVLRESLNAILLKDRK